MTTVANATGAFAFPVSLASGTYTLQTTAPGFRPSVATILIPATTMTVQLPLVGAVPVTTVGVNITGPTTMRIGQSAQLTASIVYTDGTQKDVTSVAKWTTSAPSVALVSFSGVVTAFAIGPTVITASFQDVTGTLGVTVGP